MTLLLEIARGIAALWVFLFHFKDTLASSPAVAALASYGTLAVPMFFVISGYVITFTAARHIAENKPAVNFIKRRIVRIYPVFIASLLVIVALPTAMDLVSSLKSGPYAAAPCAPCSLSIAEWISIVSLARVFIDHPGGPQESFSIINIVYWSLAIEVQFYIVVYAAICFRRYYNKLILAVTFLSLVVVFVPNDLNGGLFVHYWPQFSVGVVVANLHINGFHSKDVFGVYVRLFLTFLSIVLLLVSARSEYHQKLLFSIFFGLLIWSLAEVEGVLSALKNTRGCVYKIVLAPFLVLGSMSYSVYLLHTKLYGFSSMFSRQITQDGSIVREWVSFVLTLGFCYLFYYFVERRFKPERFFSSSGHLKKAAGISWGN